VTPIRFLSFEFIMASPLGRLDVSNGIDTFIVISAGGRFLRG